MPPRLHCDLQRFTQAVNRSGDFVQHLWIQFAVSVHVVSFLHSSDQQCCFATCLVIYIDRAELAWAPQRFVRASICRPGQCRLLLCKFLVFHFLHLSPPAMTHFDFNDLKRKWGDRGDTDETELLVLEMDMQSYNQHLQFCWNSCRKT